VQVAVPDRYQSWPGAPKQWFEVPEIPLPRHGSPDPEESAATLPSLRGAWRCRALNCQALRCRRAVHRGAEWAVAALALSVAVAAFVLIGVGGSVADADRAPSTDRTNGTLAP
jgi:hypothetical protein